MRERMEMTTHAPSVIISTLWPMLLAWLVVSLVVLLTSPLVLALSVVLLMGVVILLTFLICLRMYLGTYLFLPATQYQGARIVARLGRTETTIKGVLAGDILMKQSWFERPFHTCHIREKGTTVYLRGVKEPDKVQAWIAANFPAERPAAAKPVPRKRRK